MPLQELASEKSPRERKDTTSAQAHLPDPQNLFARSVLVLEDCRSNVMISWSSQERDFYFQPLPEEENGSTLCQRMWNWDQAIENQAM